MSSPEKCINGEGNPEYPNFEEPANVSSKLETETKLENIHFRGRYHSVGHFRDLYKVQPLQN